MSRGFLIYAHDNLSVKYHRLAVLCARLVRRIHPGVPIKLVTDNATFETMVSDGCERELFDDMQVGPHRPVSNRRRFDGVVGEYYNTSRAYADLDTQWDETIVLDADYLVLDDSLDACWGSSEPFMAFTAARYVNGAEPVASDLRLCPEGPPLLWATVMYFKRCRLASDIFSIMRDVLDNHTFYRSAYGLPGSYVRLDHALSIASHVTGGFIEPGSVSSLPGGPMITSGHRDELVGWNEGPVFWTENGGRRFEYRAGHSVHCMDKLSLERVDAP